MSATDGASIDQIARDLRRFEDLSAAVGRPVRRAISIDLVLLALTAAASIAVAAASGQVAGAAAFAAIGSAIAFLVGWSWLLRRDRQAAYEVVHDHAVREGAMWVAETGTSLPTSFGAAKRWLVEHPAGPGRATILTRVGRLAEARAALATTTPSTPVEALDRQIFERQLDLYEGKRVDTADLLVTWRSLAPSPMRDVRRWCIALIDAQSAVDGDQDPWAPLAEARPDVGKVDERVDGGRVIRNIAALHVLVAITLSFIGAFVAF